jgi:hypothetical protein
MSAEIEGEVREVHEERAVVLAQPGQALVSRDRPSGPAEMVAVASQLATILKDIVDRQRLYATISNKRYPTVEAWMTIARMDNVVAREAQPPSVTTTARTRASPSSSASPTAWSSAAPRPSAGRRAIARGISAREPSRRSMAVTRATSRAFRQQYSWIMALAGYEPTPAEEMPRDEGPKTVVWSKADNDGLRPEPERSDDGGLIGTVELGKGDADFELRQTPDGWVTAFRLVSGRKSIKAIAHQPFAELLVAEKDALLGKTVTAWGRISDETFRPKGATTDVTYQVLTLDRIKTSELDLTAPEPADELDAIAEGLPA